MAHLQQNRRVRQQPEPTTRRRRNQKEKKQKSATSSFANDYLKQSFLPVTHHKNFTAQNSPRINADFLKSLKNISNLYGITLQLFEEAIFPLNIKLAFMNIKSELEKKQADLGVAIFETSHSTATLATYKELSVGLRLYYVPLEPLLKLHMEKKKSAVNLVLSVYSYLYLIVFMPLCNHNDYLSSCYEMIGNWLENEEDEWGVEEHLSLTVELNAMRRSLKVIEKAIQNQVNLDEFENRLISFSPVNHREGELLNSANRLFEIYQQYPKASFYENFHPDLYTDEVDETIYPEQYFSFCWNNEGWINDHLMEIVNSDLQEKSRAAVPSSFQYFQCPQPIDNHPGSLDFETKLLDAICVFAEALNNL